MAKKSQRDSGRCQINLKDPNTIAFLDFFRGRKSEVIQSALEQYMQTDNRHTRELRKLVDDSEDKICLAKSILGVGSVRTAPTPVPSDIPESPKMSTTDLPFDLSEDVEEDEIFGDIDI